MAEPRVSVSGTWRLDPTALPDPWDVRGVHPTPQKGKLVRSGIGNVMLSTCAADMGQSGVGLYIGGWMLRTQLLMGTGGLVPAPPREPTADNVSELLHEDIAYVGREEALTADHPTARVPFSVTAIQDEPMPYHSPDCLLVLVVESVRNIAAHEDTHGHFNQHPWPPDSSHGTSTIEAARLVVPLPQHNAHIVARVPLKQVEFVGTSANKEQIEISSRYQDNGYVFMDVTMDYGADGGPMEQLEQPAPTAAYAAWLNETTTYWEERVWDTHRRVTDRGFTPSHLKGYRPVAIPSWPIPLLPPELWEAYPTHAHMMAVGRPGSQRFREQLDVLTTLLDIGVRTAGTLYHKPEWVAGGLDAADVAGIVGRQVQSGTDKLDLEFVYVLEALVAASTVLCTPVTPYIVEALREHFACLAHVSGDCEDFAHFIAAFMLSTLYSRVPAADMAAYAPLVAVAWILKALYWPAQVFYETRKTSEGDAPSADGVAHQAAVLLPLPFVWEACQAWPAENKDILHELGWAQGPTMRWPDADEQAVLGLTLTAEQMAAPPAWFLASLPVLSGEGTTKTAAVGVPLSWVADMSTADVEPLAQHVRGLRRRLGRLGIKGFSPSLMQENVMAVGTTTLQVDRFIRYATIVSLTPRTLPGIPLQASWANADTSTGITYETLLAGPHHAAAYQRARLLQNTMPVEDRTIYRQRIEGALAATMLAVDRPRLLHANPSMSIPGLPALMAKGEKWAPLVRLPDERVQDYACIVVPLRYLEGVTSRLWATDAAFCTVTIMHTPWSPASNGVSVVLVFIADKDVG